MRRLKCPRPERDNIIVQQVPIYICIHTYILIFIIIYTFATERHYNIIEVCGRHDVRITKAFKDNSTRYIIIITQMIANYSHYVIE